MVSFDCNAMERLNPLQTFLVVTILVRASASLNCKANWTKSNGSCYRVFTQTKEWNEADRACKDEDANLVSVHSESENEFVKNLSSIDLFWIGANDIQQEGTYKWSDGSATDYTNWSDDNTNNNSSDCVSETSSGWIVRECTGGYSLTYVCKYSLSSGQRGDIGNPLSGEIRGALFNRIPSKALIRFAILRKDGCTFFSCARMCLATTDCKSFNFNPKFGQCEINDATHQEFPHLLVNSGDSIYATLLPT